jgi:hypothetical protein
VAIPHQFRALGRHDLPRGVRLRDGRVFRLETTFKHNFLSAVGVYRNGAEQLALKCYRRAAFCGFPLAWMGRVMAAYECAALRQADDLDGVPVLLGQCCGTGILRWFTPGEPLTRNAVVSDEFFPQLMDLIARIHARGLAYVDLEKPGNILLGADGRPHLIDFQVALYWPARLGGQTSPARFVRRWLQRGDLYHVRKHWRRVRPDQLTDAEFAATYRKPWLVRWGNRIYAPLKKLRRRVFGRS